MPYVSPALLFSPSPPVHLDLGLSIALCGLVIVAITIASSRLQSALPLWRRPLSGLSPPQCSASGVADDERWPTDVAGLNLAAAVFPPLPALEGDDGESPEGEEAVSPLIVEEEERASGALSGRSLQGLGFGG